jgi:hypothetical protein
MREKWLHRFMASGVLIGALALAGCTTNRETEPTRTATEQLLISSAVDRMVETLQVHVPAGTKAFVDPQYFDGTDAKYALGAIRDRLLRSGVHLVADRKDADMVVEARSGAQSIDQSEFLIGVPKTPVPLPLAGTLTIPEIALFKRAQMKGVAKAAVTGYDAKTGALAFSTGAAYGYSHDTEWTVLLLISWSHDDLIPEKYKDDNSVLPPSLPSIP